MAIPSFLTPFLVAVALLLGVSALPVQSNDKKDKKDQQISDQSAQKGMSFEELNAMSPKARLALVLDQAIKAQEMGNVQLALALFREAQGLTPGAGRAGNLAYLNIKYRELALEAGMMDWRRVEHRFDDLRKVADQQPLWTDSQLERALAEAEIRLVNQPEDEDKESILRALAREIDLIMATRGDGLDPALLARAREYGYALEDVYGRRKGMKD